MSNPLKSAHEATDSIPKPLMFTRRGGYVVADTIRIGRLTQPLMQRVRVSARGGRVDDIDEGEFG